MGYFIDDDSTFKPCNHHEHNPPMMLYIPPGKIYIHECPLCGNATRLYPSSVTL